MLAEPALDISQWHFIDNPASQATVGGAINFAPPQGGDVINNYHFRTRVGWQRPGGGLAFMLKPLALFAFAYGISLNLTALHLGPVFPLLTHFSFGAVGAIIGTLLAQASSSAPPMGD